MKVLFPVLAVILPVVTAQGQAGEAGRTGASSSASYGQQDDRPDLHSPAGQIFALANQTRARAGLAALAWDTALAQAALAHCRQMAAEGRLSHQFAGEADPEARAAQAGAHFSVLEKMLPLCPSAEANPPGVDAVAPAPG